MNGLDVDFATFPKSANFAQVKFIAKTLKQWRIIIE